ncbi:MAG TPA: FkbM family methyltransferase [Vicinamibacterales bacterium]|jgi:FkbM family methyltransferase|nr:FkbM family methyltransferase [Vicinamibacterales bacterium]
MAAFPRSAAAGQWHAQYKALRAQVRVKAQRERTKRDELKAKGARLARRIPSVHALRHALQGRIARVRVCAAGPETRVRGEAFAARTPALASAVASLDTLEREARRTTVDGLVWWVPALPTQSVASIKRMLAKQTLPYRAISQTRDLAVGGIMLDIGANIGATAIPRAILGDARAVFCAEPDELNYRCLVANVVQNGFSGFVLPDRVAISDRTGEVVLERGKMPGSHRVVHVAPDTIEGRRRVPSMTLDDWMAHHAIDVRGVTFIKIDTQGSEVHVLTGAAALLGVAIVAWQIEVAPRLLRLAGSDPATLYRMMKAHFTHFIDLNVDAAGPRLRSIADLDGALEYLERGEAPQTDVVVYRTSPG